MDWNSSPPEKTNTLIALKEDLVDKLSWNQQNLFTSKQKRNEETICRYIPIYATLDMGYFKLEFYKS